MKNIFFMLLCVVMPIFGMKNSGVALPVSQGIVLPVSPPEMTQAQITFELVKDQPTKMVSIDDARELCPRFEFSGAGKQRMIQLYVKRQVSSAVGSDCPSSAGSLESAWIPYSWILNNEEVATSVLPANPLVDQHKLDFTCPRSKKVELRNMSALKIDFENQMTEFEQKKLDTMVKELQLREADLKRELEEKAKVIQQEAEIVKTQRENLLNNCETLLKFNKSIVDKDKQLREQRCKELQVAKDFKRDLQRVEEGHQLDLAAKSREIEALESLLQRSEISEKNLALQLGRMQGERAKAVLQKNFAMAAGFLICLASFIRCVYKMRSAHA